MEVEVDTIEYRDGASPEYQVVKMPGRPKYANIILKRGVWTGDNEFFDWWNSIQLNRVERRDMVIALLNENHEPVMIWKVRNAFPVKVSWNPLRSVGNEILLEQLEVAHEGMVVENR